MQETKNLEKILEELEYLNTSILKKLEDLEQKGVIKNLETLLKRIENSKSLIEKLDETSLILKVVYYAVLADKNLLNKTIKVAKVLDDSEVVSFLEKRLKY